MALKDASKYKDYIVKLQGKDYLMVAGQVKAAQDDGVLYGSETISIVETDTHLRVGVRIKILQKENFENISELPALTDFFFSYYDGYAQAPKIAGPNDKLSPAQKKAPLEDLETSALGRALSKAGYSLTTMATADEMNLAMDREGNGYDTPIQYRTELSKLLKAKKGISSMAAANNAAQERLNKNLADFNIIEVKSWYEELSNVTEKEPF